MLNRWRELSQAEKRWNCKNGRDLDLNLFVFKTNNLNAQPFLTSNNFHSIQYYYICTFALDKHDITNHIFRETKLHSYKLLFFYTVSEISLTVMASLFTQKTWIKHELRIRNKFLNKYLAKLMSGVLAPKWCKFLRNDKLIMFYWY